MVLDGETRCRLRETAKEMDGAMNWIGQLRELDLEREGMIVAESNVSREAGWSETAQPARRQTEGAAASPSTRAAARARLRNDELGKLNFETNH